MLHLFMGIGGYIRGGLTEKCGEWRSHYHGENDAAKQYTGGQSAYCHQLPGKQISALSVGLPHGVKTSYDDMYFAWGKGRTGKSPR